LRRKRENIFDNFYRCYIIFIDGHIFALNLIVVLYEVIKALIYVKHLKPNIFTSFVIPLSLNGCF